MSNLEADLSVKTVRQDPDSVGEVLDILQPHPDLTRVLHTIVTSDSALVADGIGDSGPAEVTLDLGDIAVEVVAITLRNRSGQTMSLSLNGNDGLFDLPDGALMHFAAPIGGVSNPLTAVSLFTTVEQVGNGYIDFVALGDPDS